jgi:hypothetical protein
VKTAPKTSTWNCACAARARNNCLRLFKATHFAPHPNPARRPKLVGLSPKKNLVLRPVTRPCRHTKNTCSVPNIPPRKKNCAARRQVPCTDTAVAPAEGRGYKAADIRQRAEGRGQRAEGRGNRAAGSGQRAEGKGQRTEGKGHRAGGQVHAFVQVHVWRVYVCVRACYANTVRANRKEGGACALRGRTETRFLRETVQCRQNTRPYNKPKTHCPPRRASCIQA